MGNAYLNVIKPDFSVVKIPLDENGSYGSTLAARLSEFEMSNYTFVPTQRTFNVPIVVTGNNSHTGEELANNIIDLLSISASALREIQVEVNGWILPCHCIGISQIVNEKGGAIKFSAKLTTRRAFWCDNGSNNEYNIITDPQFTYLTSPLSFQKIGTQTAVNEILLNDGMYAMSLDVRITDASYLDLKLYAGQETTYHHFEIFTYDRGEERRYKLDYPTKRFFDKDTKEDAYYHISANGLPPFSEYPYQSYRIQGNIIRGNMSSNGEITGTIKFHRLRVMPEW